MLYDDRDRFRVRSVMVAVTALAWVSTIATPRAAGLHIHDPGTNPLVASAAANWLLMLTAMMAPVLIQPIQFIRGQALARRRARATLLFVGGYASIWTLAGAALLWVATATRSSGRPFLSTLAALAVAVVWQCSPAKQVCLNHCHVRPPLAAFGLRADADAIAFGAIHAAWCIGSCGAMMVLPLTLPGGHTAAMMAVAILIFCERLEKPAAPAWQWRGVGTAWRVIRGRLRVPLRAMG